MAVINGDRTAEEEVAPGVEANARLTGATAAVLLILLAVEGVTVLEVTASCAFTSSSACCSCRPYC